MKQEPISCRADNPLAARCQSFAARRACVLKRPIFYLAACIDNNYRLTHSASELSRFTCTSSLTMNEKFQYCSRPPSAVLKNFEFIVSERVQVNPDNSRAMSASTFLLFKLNTLQEKSSNFESAKAMV